MPGKMTLSASTYLAIADLLFNPTINLSQHEIAERLGITRSRVETAKRKFQSGEFSIKDGVLLHFGVPYRSPLELPDPNLPPPLVTHNDALDMENAYLRQRLSDIEASPAFQETQRQEVMGSGPDKLTPAQLWQIAEDQAELDCAVAANRMNFRWRSPDGLQPVAVTFVADQHIGPGTPVFLKRMREDAQLIASTPGVYAILAGDGVDNHIKHRAAVLAARSQPSDQWKLYEFYLRIFAHKIILIISGNHDAWTNEIAGVDMVHLLAEKNTLVYAPDEAYIEALVGSIRYDIAVRHQYRYNSSFNLLHTVKRWWEHGAQPFDIGVIGHHHTPEVGDFRRHGKQYWAARPGSYQLTSAYARRLGFPLTEPTCPTFVLDPGERRIVGFDDVRPAITYLQALRSETS